MNKKIIIILTVIFSFGGISSFLIIRYHSKNQDSLEVKSKEEKKQPEQKKKLNTNIKGDQKKIKEKKEEKIRFIPWQFSWEGAILSYGASCFISNFFSDLIFKEKVDIINKKPYFTCFLSLIFEFIIFPFSFALKKFGKKSYRERLGKVLFGNKIKIIVNLSLLFGYIGAYLLIEKCRLPVHKIKKINVFLILIFLGTLAFDIYKESNPLEKSEEEEEEETEEKVPWQTTWVGKLLSLGMSLYFANFAFSHENGFLNKQDNNDQIINKIELRGTQRKDKIEEEKVKKIISNTHFLSFFLIFEVIILPISFAFRKFEKKKYWKRLSDIFSLGKIIIDVIIFIFIAFVVLHYYNIYSQKNLSCSEFLKDIFIWCS